MLGFLGGTGPEGRGLALRFGIAGEPVMIGSRDAARAEEAAEELKKLGNLVDVHGGLNEDVSRSADIVFITVPYLGQWPLLQELKGYLDGKVVVDTVAPLLYSDGQFSMHEVPEGSAALQAQAILHGSSVVAAFQTVSAHDLLNLDTSVQGDVVTCADDDDARTVVMNLVGRIDSLRAINGGGLINAKYVEGITTLLLSINRIYKARSSVKFAGV